MILRTLQDLISCDRVLIRVDYNVPCDFSGAILDHTRIQASLPTIHHFLNKKTKMILLSHKGRPQGKADSQETLLPCARALETMLQRPVRFIQDISSCSFQDEITLLENMRFHPAEEHPKEHIDFIKKLASYGNAYVNDAFSSSHRTHASIIDLPECFPRKARCAGMNFAHEVTMLTTLLASPKRPFHVIQGGAKLSSKLPALRALLPHIDELFI